MGKWTSKKEIIADLYNNKLYTMQQLGSYFGVSRQRAEQILHQLEIPTRSHADGAQLRRNIRKQKLEAVTA
jgi:DNA-directed RNA polymerase sigma subunit (sigma70/sigma32)